jgi:hypothetical protein
MTNGFPLPDWFPWQEAWPSWIPNAPRNDGLGPPVPQRNLPAWPTFGWEQGPNGGLLGNLGAPRDSGGGGLLGNLGASRGSGNGGLLGHLSAPAGPPLFDRGLDIEGVGPWGWPKLPIPSAPSPTHWPAPLPPPTSSSDNWKQDESVSSDPGPFNWVETPNGGLLAAHPNGNGVDWVETPSGGLLAVPKPQMDPSWLRSALAVGTSAGTSVVPAQPSARPTEVPSYDDAGSGKWDSPALPESSAWPSILPAAPLGMWSDFHRSQAPFDADAGFPATPAQDDEQPWPDPSLIGRDQTTTQLPPPLPGPPQLPPVDSQVSPDVGRNFHRWQLPFDANVRIPAASAHDQLWPDAALGMRDQSRWGSLTLPRPTVTPAHATNPNSIPDDSITDRTAIVSDVDPETWIAGLRYANRTGRGPRWRGGRELTVPEQNRIWFYDSAHRTLRELDPKNRQLQSLSSENWVPRQQDINRLNEEIARVRREQSLVDIESHHTLPREFTRQFNKAGFDIRDYIVYLARDQHRFRPKGLHTGSENWNAQWRQFFKGRKNASPDEIIEQLNIMLNQIPR